MKTQIIPTLHVTVDGKMPWCKQTGHGRGKLAANPRMTSDYNVFVADEKTSQYCSNAVLSKEPVLIADLVKQGKDAEPLLQALLRTDEAVVECRKRIQAAEEALREAKRVGELVMVSYERFRNEEMKDSA